VRVVSVNKVRYARDARVKQRLSLKREDVIILAKMPRDFLVYFLEKIAGPEQTAIELFGSKQHICSIFLETYGPIDQREPQSGKYAHDIRAYIDHVNLELRELRHELLQYEIIHMRKAS
jgi:hypothetical protein